MIQRALLRALVLAPIVAVIDGLLAAQPLHSASTWIGNAALAMLATIGLGIPAFLIVGYLARSRLATTAARAWSAGGEPRARVLLVGAYVALAAVTVWLVGILCVLRSRAGFQMPRVAAVFGTSELVLAAVVAVVVGAFALPAAAAWMAHRDRLVRALSHRGLPAALFFATAIAMSVGVWGIAHWFGSSVDATPAYAAVGAVLAGTGVALFIPGSRCSAVAVVACVAIVLCTAGLSLRVPATRAAVATGGPFARSMLGVVYSASDHDGDGVPGWLGADCDDDNPAISPLAVDIAGNGIDENCSGADAPVRVHPDRAMSAARKPDIVLVTIDTLRADHLGLYGYRRPTSPQLDAFARRAAVFDMAEAPAAVTRFSLPGILFGRYVRASETTPPASSLAASLLADGYRTHAVIALPHVLAPALRTGFQLAMTVSSVADVDNARNVTDAALDWIGDPAAQPRFLWVHYADPHYPYTPATTPFGDDDIDRYDAEIAEMDAELGRLLAALATRDNTIVVVTADHGEAFGERGYSFHGQTLLQDQIHVPLLIAGPGIPARRVVEPVSLTSVAPTLLDLAHIPLPAPMSDVSLATSVLDGVQPAGRAIAELTRGRVGISRNALALVDGSSKIIWDIDDDSYSRYDLAHDPEERHDLGRPDAAALQRFHDVLDRDLAGLPDLTPLASIGANR